jgi:hypothetical protein
MKVRRLGLAALAASLIAPAAAQARQAPLDSYRVGVKSAGQIAKLRALGYDVTEGRQKGSVTVVATRHQARGLRGKGLKPTLVRDKRGRTERQLAAAQAASGGYKVWRPYARDAFDDQGHPTDNLLTELRKLARAHPGLIKLETIGHSVRGVPIVALKVTRGARSTRDGSKPSVLYSSTQHAREWISTEVNRRLLRLFVDNYGRSGAALDQDGKALSGVSATELTRLVRGNELWFVLVCNPDGYDYTFQSPDTRLWRKNLRDNDGDGQITELDGVDPNRNFPTKWNYDNEGSSDILSSETYRGTAPASEPETRALDGLLKRVHFRFQDNLHSFAQLLLYPFGWQVETPSADEPIFQALNGTVEKPAVEGFTPEVSARLYTTNGETTDQAYTKYGTLAWTTELDGGDPAKTGGQIGFVFQDDPADVEAEFEKNIAFNLDMARSARDPEDPVSSLGNEAPDFRIDPFAASNGNPQTVQVDAKRSLGRVALRWRVNGGAVRSAATHEWKGGERYGGVGKVYYHELRGQVRGTRAGDKVEVWFTAGPDRSESFTYTVASDTGADVLVLSAENYKGGSPDYADATRPAYLKYYTAALDRIGVSYDVYDVDANDETAPSYLGVLSHYKAVVWYTGDDYVTRLPGQQPGTGASRITQLEQLAVRDFLNEGGKLLYTGVSAGQEYFEAFNFERVSEPPFCDTNDDCLPLSNDFLQYYLGAYRYIPAFGARDDGSAYDVLGIAGPLKGVSIGFNGPDSAQNQVGNGNGNGPSAAVVTSSILPKSTYPQFASKAVAGYVLDKASPFAPFSGANYVYSGQADQTYKRLTHTLDLTGKTSGSLDFRMSYDTEPDYDYTFVESHTVGQDDWTTLPAKLDDGTDATSPDVGLSCISDTDAGGSDWQDAHPFLAHYQTKSADGTSCTSAGTTGDWNAATGTSGGWQHCTIDLSKFAGKNVEVSIAAVSDPATQGLGVFVDNATLKADGATVAPTDFEADLGGWTAAGPPEGSPPNPSTWKRTGTAFSDGPAIRTRDTLYYMFGIEGISGAANRTAVLRRSLRYLLGNP